MRVLFTTFEEIESAAGEEIGTTDWVEITQERVNQFADATGDHQWIHVDPERAAKESPFGGPIAHGYLTLSLLPMLASQIVEITGFRLTVNYGTEKVRFPAPVPVGGRVRGSAVLDAAEPIEGGLHILITLTVQIEGGSKPAMVATSVTRRYV
jgi:acyl dehydratase